MNWKYDQTSGSLYSPEGEVSGVGYAGKGLGKNNPSLQSVKNTGPIPKGWYTIGEAFTHPHTGPVSMRLTQDKENEMFDRDRFLMHGDNPTHTASDGCIIMGHDVRVLVSKSTVRRLQVV